MSIISVNRQTKAFEYYEKELRPRNSFEILETGIKKYVMKALKHIEIGLSVPNMLGGIISR